ncbi:MAG TPA: metallophosphoesterase [Polyangiales bacterium]|nr:metallophosphoesterase [Polyangiales bacterium]
MRVLHVSDVHVTVSVADMPWREMLNKRLLGAVNYKLRRRRQFAHAADKLQELAQFAQREQVDLVICTGDYTALGTEPEFAAARAAIEGLATAKFGYITVPGNHDVYIRDLDYRRFERHFASFLQGDPLPGAAVDGPWPVVRLIGDELAVIAVNSARPNPQVWRSSGRIPERQLQALQQLLAAPEIAGRFVFVVTHYAPRRPDGTQDHWTHCLENADAFLEACRGMRRGAILHGHIHHRFRLTQAIGPEIFGAGSTTCERRESLWLFDVTRDSLTATPGRFSGGRYEL